MDFDAQLPWTRGAMLVAEVLPLLELTSEGTWLDGEPLDGVESIDEFSRIYVAADATLNVEDILRVLRRLPRSIQLRILVYSRDLALSWPPPAGLDQISEAMVSHSPGELAALFYSELSRRAASCLPLGRLIDEVAQSPPEDRHQTMARGLEAALRECNCGWVDVDAYLYLGQRSKLNVHLRGVVI